MPDAPARKGSFAHRWDGPSRAARILWLALATALAMSACAPTTIGPAIIRIDPAEGRRPSSILGLRTGPRIAAALPGSPLEFRGDRDSFHFPQQLSLAYDFGATRALSDRSALHFGAQGEFLYPFPLPAYGMYAGVSHAVQAGPIAVAPAICARGATDLGLARPSASQIGAELSASFSLREGTSAFALVPFASANGILSDRWATALYVGGVLALRFDKIEVTGGFGRVFLIGGESWNVPLLGIRGGD